MSFAITPAQLKAFQADYQAQSQNRVLERAVTKNGVRNASFDWHAQAANDPHFSIDLATGDVSDQKQSGRCWMFAALNTMRHDMQAKFNLPDNFELSQSYQFFWDKFEKANYFYENVINTAELPHDDRKVAWLMATPQQDGGQWDMMVALIEKYGVVPQSTMPETYNSSKSREINEVLNHQLRHDAVILRQLVNDYGVEDERINQTRQEMLNRVYRMLALAFGEPVQSFDFEYRDKKSKEFHPRREPDATRILYQVRRLGSGPIRLDHPSAHG